MARPRPTEIVRLILVAGGSLGVATLAVALLEASVRVADASSIFIVAVVATGFLAGTVGAIVAALGSFLLHNYFFIEPVGTFVVDDPGEWLELALLLFVGIVVGQLVALLRSRADLARAREREALVSCSG
jgi:K+-sensing histidine kinase KdpD